MSALPKYKFLLSMSLVAAVGAFPLPSQADNFPHRPVRIVVPYGTGGGADVFARTIGRGLEQDWKQGVVVENRPGAAGNIGTMEVVRAKPDGYTLLLQNISMVTNYAIQGQLPYSPTEDLTPILLLGSTPHAIVVHSRVPASNLKELAALIQKEPGKYAYASCGVGTPQHFTMEVLRQKLDLDMTHAGYKGCSPAVTDVVGGQIPVAIVSANLVGQYLNSGRLKAIGVTSQRRYSGLPDVPTLEEQGVGPFDYVGWYALMGPKKLPADVAATITSSVEKVLAYPTVKKSLDDNGIEVHIGSAERLLKTITEDSERYYTLARKLGLKAE